MNRNQKMKALALSMFAGIVIVATPQVRALTAQEYTNKCNKADAQIVLNVESDKTEVRPGDTFTVSFDLDKLPSNGFGVNALSFKLAYDSTKVKVAYDETYEVPILEYGPVGQKLGFSLSFPELKDDGTDKIVAHASAIDARSAGMGAITGNVFTMEFTVLDNATPGSAGIVLVGDTPDPGGDVTKNVAGMAASGVKKEGSVFSTDSTLPVYVESNVNEVNVIVEATSVKFNDVPATVAMDTAEKNTLELGSKLQITPTGAQGNKVTWASSNNSVATVSNTGTVTAKGNGTATITATVNGKVASVNVNVSVAPTSIEFANLPDVNLDVTTNPTISLKNSVKINPSDAKVDALEWSSSNPSVATVDQNGTVTAVGNGQAEITVKYTDAIKATKTVSVTTSVSNVALSKSTVVLDMVSKQNDTLTYTLNPATSITRNVSATVDNNDVVGVTVNEATKTITLTAKRYGTARLTLDVDGKKAYADISVTVPLSAINVSTNTVTFYKGDDASVTATVDPEGSKWETLEADIKSGSSVRPSVNPATGVVSLEGLTRGTSVISIYANGSRTGDLLKEVTVEVKENRVTAINLTADSDEMLRGKTMTIASSYTTEESESIHKTTDNTKITWTSSDPTVATVDQNGKVTAISEGEVTITAKMENSANQVTKTYTLTVIENKLAGLKINDEDKATLKEALDLTTEGSVVIPFEIDPEDCTDTAEEILAKINENLKYNKEEVDVEVAYDPATGKGTIKVVCKVAGAFEVEIPVGFEETEDENGETVKPETIKVKLNVTDPEDVETGDIAVGAMAVMMVISLGGIVVSKKVLVK